MKKTLLLLVVNALCLTYAYAQKGDYIATDSSLRMGISLVRGTPKQNSQYIMLKAGNGETKYTPKQIKEYGFRDGTVYESAEIRLGDNERKVFLERLIKGNITLYRYSSRNQRFYIRKDSSDLVEVPRDIESLKLLSQGCNNMKDAIRLASHNKRSLERLVEHYNTCKRKPFPYIKVGILAGFIQTSLSQPSDFYHTILEGMSIPASSSPTIGLFADVPIKMSEFSLHPELLFTSNNFSANQTNIQSDIDILIKLSTLQLPVLIRYTVPTPTWRLFFNVGPHFTYNIENTSGIYHATVDHGTVTIKSPIQEKLVADYMIGYAGGLGVQRNLNFRKTISAELRYTRAAGSDNTLIQKGVEIIVGFTF